MTVEIIARDVPDAILAELELDAEAKDVTRQEVAVAILADAFLVKRQPSNRRYIDGNRSSTLVLSVPEKLRLRIQMVAVKTGATMRGVICAQLARNYDLPPVPTGRRPKGEA